MEGGAERGRRREVGRVQHCTKVRVTSRGTIRAKSSRDHLFYFGLAPEQCASGVLIMEKKGGKKEIHFIPANLSYCNFSSAPPSARVCSSPRSRRRAGREVLTKL